MDANRLHHIFGDPRHNLGALERQYGGAEAAAEALEAMVKAAYENGVLSAHEGERYRQVFDVAGLVTLRCDIHEHMRALILVLDTPFFVLSEPSGHYRLSRLPAGHYTLKVWLSSQTTLARPVDLAPGSVVEANFP